MLEKKQDKAVTLKSRVKKNETNKDKSLIDLIREDSDLFDFIKRVKEHDLRQHAHELLSQRIRGVMH